MVFIYHYIYKANFISSGLSGMTIDLYEILSGGKDVNIDNESGL